MAAIVPGIIALISMPYFISVYPPEIRDAREAQQMIREELKVLVKCLSKNGYVAYLSWH